LDGPLHIELNENGENLVAATGIGSAFLKSIAESPMSSKSDDSPRPLTQWDETSRLSLLLPNRVVKPGDKWESRIDNGEMGRFDGITTLLGYCHERRQFSRVYDCVTAKIMSFYEDYKTKLPLPISDSTDVANTTNTVLVVVRLTQC
jgi:hypothetical protein